MSEKRDQGRRPALAGRLRSLAINCLVALTSLALCFVVLEVGLRAYATWQREGHAEARSFSSHLGWVTAPHVRRTESLEGYGEINYSSGEYGFRVFGDVDTDKAKVFVVGDSFTFANTVSDGETYYDEIRRGHEELEIFAYGGAGYGSLQEAMILNQYLDEIQPHLILWQFTSNDLINNLHALESQSLSNNNLMTRPYLENGRVEWRFPERYRGLAGRLIQRSHLLRRLKIMSNILISENFGSIENELVAGHPLLEETRSTTREIMELVRQRAGTIPIVTFVADDSSFSEGVFVEISEELGFTHVASVQQALEEAKGRGEKVDGLPYDGHWNSTGHAVVGRTLLDALMEGSYLEASAVQPGPPLDLLAYEGAAADSDEFFSLASLDGTAHPGIDSLEGPHPQADMPRPVRWMVSESAEIRFQVRNASSGTLRLRVKNPTSQQTLYISLNGEPIVKVALAEGAWTNWESGVVGLRSGENVLGLDAQKFFQPPERTRRLFLLFEELQLTR
jgi:hypothetical protein